MFLLGVSTPLLDPLITLMTVGGKNREISRKLVLHRERASRGLDNSRTYRGFGVGWWKHQCAKSDELVCTYTALSSGSGGVCILHTD
jgi:hypothetical protein